MRFVNAFFLFISLASAPAASANCAAQFKREAKALGQTMIKNGYGKFGRLDIAEILKYADRVVVKPGGNQIAHHRMRSTARWQTEGNKVTVTVDCKWYREHELTERSITAFHEYVWSAGFYDEWYWISLTGWLLTDKALMSLLTEKEIANIADWVTLVAALNGGGVTGVGGGGEVETIRYKISTLRMYARGMAKAENSVMRELYFDKFLDTIDEKLNSNQGWRMGIGTL